MEYIPSLIPAAEGRDRDEELPWTVSRCNRLLRPLSSKLATLRKELERPRSAFQEARATSSAFATKHTPQKTTNYTRPANKPRGFEKASDPDWRPGACRAKKTYGGRKAKGPSGPRSCGADVQHAARPGEIAFTPLLARMVRQTMDSPLAQSSPLKKYTKRQGPLVAVNDRTERPGAHVPANIKKHMDGLRCAYANIMIRTQETKVAIQEKKPLIHEESMSRPEPTHRKGTSSLMSACLRKLPAYIELEEHFAELDQMEEDGEVEDRDIANEVYEFLENRFEQRQGQGWRHFRQVLRAQATSLLCRAFADGVIESEYMFDFFHYCLQSSAFDEAEQLLIAALPAVEPLPIPLSVSDELFGGKSQYLRQVKVFVDRSRRYRFLYDVLDHMVAHELLPLEWLATTRMCQLWDRLVHTIITSDNAALASCSRFIETCVLAGMGLPDERLLLDDTGSVARRFVPSSREDLRQALNTTYSSLFTLLCSMSLVHSERDDIHGQSLVIAKNINWTLDAIAIALASRSNVDGELRILGANSEDLQLFAQRACWAIFSPFLIRLDGSSKDCTRHVSTQSLMRELGNVVQQYSMNGANSSSVLASLPLLASATAQRTGRIRQNDGFDQLRCVVQAMAKKCYYHRLPHKLWTLKRVALETATEFADFTDDSEHLKYADEVEKEMRASGRLVIMPTPRKADKVSTAAINGYRWEDGIAEWVSCTPVTLLRSSRPRGLPKREIRSLDLLPSPAQSEDEEGADFVQDSDHESCADPILPSSPILQSSFVKRRSQLPTPTSSGKRTRASSPSVVVPAKRARTTPPGTPVIFYPQLPEDKVNEGKRQLRRSTLESKSVRHNLKTQRSRSSLGGGLRDVRKVSYSVGVDGAEDDSEDELSFNS